ncbi:MAG: T9SS type A sorting domain-containing protein [Ignavibacteriaceae bacterium]
MVTIKVYDQLGKEVATLVNEEKPAGNYSVNFNASKLSSGVYFYRMQAGGFVETRKLVLMK